MDVFSSETDVKEGKLAQSSLSFFDLFNPENERST